MKISYINIAPLQTNILFAVFFVLILICSLLTGCSAGSIPEVIIYTSVDQFYSEPVLKVFEKQTGIRVLAVYDVEATKTTGLVNRLIAEKNNPKADLFWSGEFAQTILLKEKEILAPYRSQNIDNIPPQYIDSGNYWAGFSGRARIIIVNTELLKPESYPSSIFDFLDADLPANRIGIANPLFGTTSTHAAALYAALGPEKAKDYFMKLYERGIQVVDGNSVVKDMAAAGQLLMGLTDTDDFCVALSKGEPVTAIFPDQDSLGTLVIPNTVALIAKSSQSDEGKKLYDFLVSEAVEQMLVDSGWCQIPLRQMDMKGACLDSSDIRMMEVKLEDVYKQLEPAQRELKDIFMR